MNSLKASFFEGSKHVRYKITHTSNYNHKLKNYSLPPIRGRACDVYLVVDSPVISQAFKDFITGFLVIKTSKTF